jgi:hypothetical protein
VVTVADAALSLAWLASHFALHRAYRRWHHAAPSVVAPRLLLVLKAALHQVQMQAAAVTLTSGLQLLYLAGPFAPPLVAAAALRTSPARRRLRRGLLSLLVALLALSRTPLPVANYRLLRAVLIRSGLAKLLMEYHSFRLIEEVRLIIEWGTAGKGRAENGRGEGVKGGGEGRSCACMRTTGAHQPPGHHHPPPTPLYPPQVPVAPPPPSSGILYACFPHGVVPYGVLLFWLDRLAKNRPLGGVVASVLFRLPLLRQWLALAGMVPATARHLRQRLRTPGTETFLVPGGIAEMFLNDPDREVKEGREI